MVYTLDLGSSAARCGGSSPLIRTIYLKFNSLMLLSHMFSKLNTYFLYFILLLTLDGCTLIRMGQEATETMKTATTFGYQNGKRPDKQRNVKDYIVDENEFVILAESPYKTLYKLRVKTVSAKLNMLNDLVDYCEDHDGTVQYGLQYGKSIAREFDSIDFEFSNIKEYYKKGRLTGYKGWMKCINTGDDFEVKRKGETSYFLITHENEQLQGYSLQWYIDYFDLEDIDLNTLNIGLWSYSALVQMGGICILNNGEMYISNRYTQDKEVSLDEYFLQQLDPHGKGKGYLLSSGHISCQNSDNEQTNFIYDIAYSTKYRKILYTRRETSSLGI